VSCKKPQPIAGEDVARVEVGIDAAFDSGTDAPSDVPDADPDACVPGDTWDARIEQKNRWRPEIKMMLPGSLDVVIPRMGLRKAVYPDCGMTGGGCGDCSKPASPDRISCDLKSTRVNVQIGIDDVGPTSVTIVQRGDKVFADWSEEVGVSGGTARKWTDLVVTLPCAVKIRFVR
jgi:hypothetical protein